VPYYAADRYLAPDIERARQWVRSGSLTSELAHMLPSSAA
jgi:histidine ammonia-lyase